MSTILNCAVSQWTPGLGDNHPMGWLTVVVYLASAWAALRAALSRQDAGPDDGRERRFWWLSAALLLGLAINKQLDLQSLVTAIGRCHAQLAGWYQERHEVQRGFILFVVAGGVLAIGALAFMLRPILAQVWLALLGLGFVVLFVAIRAASFHHMDALIGSLAAGARLNWALELPGPILVLAVAWRRSGRNRPPNTR